MGARKKMDETPDTGMISAVTGLPVEGLLYEPRRNKISRGSAIVFYVILLIALYFMPAALPDVSAPEEIKLPNLVFVFEEGPGGGGGGGGDESPEPPSIQKVAGEDQARLALKVEEPEPELVYEDEEDEEIEEDEEEEPPEEETVDEIKAPVVAQAPDDFDQKGILEGPEQLLENGGAGDNGGAGGGSGTGIGPGRGPGLGPGWGGGFGGGAYRIGSGVEAPILRRQVRPEYTDHALSRKIQGTVLLEIIILKDGTVGPVRISQSLDPGLDQKAIEAVRQFLFIPGKFRGEPVDVVAEIAVDFSLL
jgi:TonB family protein